MKNKSPRQRFISGRVMKYVVALLVAMVGWSSVLSGRSYWVGGFSHALLILVGTYLLVRWAISSVFFMVRARPRAALAAHAPEPSTLRETRHASALLKELRVSHPGRSPADLSRGLWLWAAIVEQKHRLLLLVLLFSPALGDAASPANLEVRVLVLTLVVLGAGVADASTGFLRNRRDALVNALQDSLQRTHPSCRDFAERGFSLSFLSSGKLQVAVRVSPFAWMARAVSGSAERSVDELRTGHDGLDCVLEVAPANTMDTLRLVSGLSPRWLEVLVGHLYEGAVVHDGWLMVSVKGTSLDFLNEVVRWVGRGAELQNYFFALESADPARIVARHVEEARGDSLDMLARAIRRLVGDEPTKLADAWSRESRLEDRQGELLTVLEPAARAYRAGQIIAASPHPGARADGIFGLVAGDCARFVAEIRDVLEQSEVQTLDALGERATRWRADALTWSGVLRTLDVPAWARVGVARMLVVSGDSLSLARAVSLLRPRLDDRRGRLLDHLHAIADSCDDGELLELVERHIIDEKVHAAGRAGSLSLSASAGAGDLSIKSTESAERSLENGGGQ